MFWIGLGVGAVIGCIVGIFAISFCVIGKTNDKE